MDWKPYIKKHITHHAIRPVSFDSYGWKYSEEDRDVVLLVVAGIWAMVRRPGSVPYVVHIKELKPTVASQPDRAEEIAK